MRQILLTVVMCALSIMIYNLIVHEDAFEFRRPESGLNLPFSLVSGYSKCQVVNALSANSGSAYSFEEEEFSYTRNGLVVERWRVKELCIGDVRCEVGLWFIQGGLAAIEIYSAKLDELNKFLEDGMYQGSDYVKKLGNGCLSIWDRRVKNEYIRYISRFC